MNTDPINETTSEYFHVCRRNRGHWDIRTEEGRWKIRGGEGNFSVLCFSFSARQRPQHQEDLPPEKIKTLHKFEPKASR